MHLDDYLTCKFPGLHLRPPLFYNWDYGIRFELGEPTPNIDLNIYMERIYYRSITLFNELHSIQDDLLLIAQVHHSTKENYLRNRKLNIFYPNIKSKEVLHRMQLQVTPFIFADIDDDLDLETHLYMLQCKVQDLKCNSFIKAICNREMAIKPKIFHDIYMINLSKDTIFHIYDDRGCDVIGSAKESISSLYKTYNEWILAYDKETIDQVFREQ